MLILYTSSFQYLGRCNQNTLFFHHHNIVHGNFSHFFSNIHYFKRNIIYYNFIPLSFYSANVAVSSVLFFFFFITMVGSKVDGHRRIT
jgi:hypothetical protein